MGNTSASSGSATVLDYHEPPSAPDYLHGSERYRELGVLGEGRGAVVIKALDLNTKPPMPVAIKLVPRGEHVGAYSAETASDNVF